MLLVVATRTHLDPKMLQSVVRHVIGITILLACAAMGALWLRRWFDPGMRIQPKLLLTQRSAIVASGALVGTLVAFTSIGSGSITLPLLAFILPAVGLKRLIGSEIAFAALLVPVAAVGHLSLGDTDARIASPPLPSKCVSATVIESPQGFRGCRSVDRRASLNVRSAGLLPKYRLRDQTGGRN